MWLPALRFPTLILACLVIAAGDRGMRALATSAQQTARVEPALSVTCETFCSETKLRTTNARIRWSLPRAALAAINLTSLSAASQRLEVTVYKNGFDKGLSVALPISAATPARPVLPLAQTPQTSATQPRAFQIRLIEIEQPRAADAAATEMGVVIENLEPGVTYTWRVAIDTPAGRIVSSPTRCQARVCPADSIRTTGVPRHQP
jgi:hypothetical protein